MEAPIRHIPSLKQLAQKQVLKQRFTYLKQFRGRNIVIDDEPDVTRVLFMLAFKDPSVSVVRLSERSIVLIM